MNLRSENMLCRSQKETFYGLRYVWVLYSFAFWCTDFCDWIRQYHGIYPAWSTFAALYSYCSLQSKVSFRNC